MRVDILAKAVTNKQEQSTNGKSGFKSLIPLFTLISFKLPAKRLQVAIFEMLDLICHLLEELYSPNQS